VEGNLANLGCAAAAFGVAFGVVLAVALAVGVGIFVEKASSPWLVALRSQAGVRHW